MKTVATPGFMEEVARHGNTDFDVLDLLSKGEKPSMVVGDPKVKHPFYEDEGCTFKIPAPFKFFAIRDDHSSECDCGCGGQSIVTFLLPEEY